MTTVANQRVFRVRKEAKPKVAKIVIDRDYFEAATHILKPSTVLVLLSLISRQENKQWAFSPQEVANRMNLSVATARNAFNELIEKGFLINATTKDGRESNTHFTLRPYTRDERYKEFYNQEEEAFDDDLEWN